MPSRPTPISFLNPFGRLAAGLIALAGLGSGAAWVLASSPLPNLPPTECDGTYCGITFREASERVMAPVPVELDPLAPNEELKLYAEGLLPRFRSGAAELFLKLKAAARAAIQSKEDFLPRLPKLVHPIGICFTGEWEVGASATGADGVFSPGFRGLFIGRASSADGKATRGQKRPFGLAGKIFPTLDPEQRVRTMNFVTIDNLSGTRAAHFLDVRLTNEPKAGFALTPFVSIAIFQAFNAADSKIFMRPLDPMARIANVPWEPRAPKWMQLRAAAGMPRVDENDFRNELDIQNYPDGLKLDILVSDTSKDPHQDSAWKTVGKIHLKESAVTYACDRQLRFQHSRVR